MKSAVPELDSNTLALDRTVLANERTYQAWLRTGMAALASGLGLAKFLRGTIPSSILLTLATVLILFSAIAFLSAAWRYSHLHVRMVHLDIDAMPPRMLKVISYVLAGCSLLALYGLLLTAMH